MRSGVLRSKRCIHAQYITYETSTGENSSLENPLLARAKNKIYVHARRVGASVPEVIRHPETYSFSYQNTA